jgi:hypothetical protein
MDFLYISPEFPPNYANFIVQLNLAGIDVWGLGEADFYAMPEPLRAAMRWYVKTDLRDFEAVKRAIAELLAVKVTRGRPGSFDCVESHNEQWLRLESMINEEFGVEGIRLDDLDRLKKKSVMKAVFEQNGLKVAGGGRVADLDHAIQLSRTLGYPLILKPDEGVGAGGVYRIEDERQLVDVLPRCDSDYVLESFVDGRIVTYDGLTDHSGKVIFENSLVYGDGVLESVLGRDTFFYVNRRIPVDLKKIGCGLVPLFNIQRKFFHFEFFALDNGYTPIEINCRPPGGSILDMMNYSIDDDLYRAYARMMAADDVVILPLKKYYVCYLGRKKNEYVHSHSDILSRYGQRLVEHNENPPLYHGAMGRYRYIFRSETESEISDIAAYVLDKLPTPSA